MTTVCDPPRPPSGTHASEPRSATEAGSQNLLLAALIDGMRRPSVVGTIGALVVVLIQLVVCCVVITPRTLARIPAGYMVDNQYDVFTHATFLTHQMHYSPAKELGVLLVGSSTLREAIVDDESMAQALTESMGVPVDFFRVPSGWQSLWETVAVVDHLPAGFRGVIVVGIDPGRMGRPRELLQWWLETPLLAIDSPHFREEIRLAGLEPPRRTGIFLLDHARFFSARKNIPLRLVGGPIEPVTHFTHLLDPWSEERWQQVEAGELDEWMAGFTSNGQANMAIVQRLIEREHRRGNQVVLLETPLHPRARRACGQAYDDYLLEMQQFAQQQAVPFWRLDDEAQITEEDFMDFVHLSTHTSQLRFQTVLMNKLEPVLREIRQRFQQRTSPQPATPAPVSRGLTIEEPTDERR
jgi:hypothetical protein